MSRDDLRKHIQQIAKDAPPLSRDQVKKLQRLLRKAGAL